MNEYVRNDSEHIFDDKKLQLIFVKIQSSYSMTFFFFLGNITLLCLVLIYLHFYGTKVLRYLKFIG